MQQYLRSTDIIDWDQTEVRDLATTLAAHASGPVEIAARCFEWVRDEVRHSLDYQLNPVTCTASEVLRRRTGYCYAKSHLLAALLRANGIPAGLCYQRLSLDGVREPFSLHGLNAVYLDESGWYRVDPRGNRPGVDAQFTPPVERLAFTVHLSGEADLLGIYADPLPVVVEALRTYRTWNALGDHLPDIEVSKSGSSP